MLINNKNNPDNHVKFVLYTGKYPNLCRGTLTLEIDGEIVHFSNSYIHSQYYDGFWRTGGESGFKKDYSDAYVTTGEWIIDVDMLPDKYKKYAAEIDEVFNANVEYGCCGGCL